MSNRKHTSWTEAEITAANAERLLTEWWEGVETEAYRRVVTAALLADLEAAGHSPGDVARMEREMLERLDGDFWRDCGLRTGILPLGS